MPLKAIFATGVAIKTFAIYQPTVKTIDEN